MAHASPKRTIPPPRERQPARRWPLQVLVGGVALGAILLLMQWLNEPSGPATDRAASTGDTSRTPTQPDQGEPPASVEDATTGREADDAEFVTRLERSAARRFLRDTPYTADVAELVAGAQIADAAALLEARSAGGDRDATVVLLHLQALCERQTSVTGIQDPSAPGSGSLENELARAAPVPAEVRRRIELSTAAERDGRLKLKRACQEARFGTPTLEQRLRSAAAAGHEASLWALARRTDDPQLRDRQWLSAAMLGYPPAQADLADSLLQESLQGDRRNRGRMNFWLEAAAKHSPQVKRQLGECLLNGCNAQPPDSESAVPLLREAALLGELAAFGVLASVSRSDPMALSDEELYGLQSFLERLNDSGCYGPAAYPTAALRSVRTLREIGTRLSPHALREAEELAAAHWRDHGPAARRAQGCG